LILNCHFLKFTLNCAVYWKRDSSTWPFLLYVPVVLSKKLGLETDCRAFAAKARRGGLSANRKTGNSSGNTSAGFPTDTQGLRGHFLALGTWPREFSRKLTSVKVADFHRIVEKPLVHDASPPKFFQQQMSPGKSWRPPLP